MNARQLISALRRVPFAVLVHQVRRKSRDALTKSAPAAYQRKAEITAARFPAICDNRRIPADLADFIACYYKSSPAACREAAAGIFDLMGTKVDFGSVEAIDWRHRLEAERDHNLWRMKLCQLEIVHSLLADGRDEDIETVTALLDSFERAAGFDLEAPFRTVWSPYGASHRLLAILSGLALAQARGGMPPALEARVHRFLHRDAAFVRANVEHDLRNNHTERNLAALCLYGMVCTPFGAAETARLDSEVHAIVEQTILPDGMQIERSAMYQGLSVMALRIFAASPFLSQQTRALAIKRGAAAEDAWLMMSHRDGDISLFNDSWIGETPRARDVLAFHEIHWEQSSLPDAGYVRMASGEIDLWMDAGAIGPDWNPGHGHADFLAVEIDVAGERLIVDPGTSQYSTGQRRTLERSAASHNGPGFAGFEPVEYMGCFKVGRLAAAAPIAFEPSERSVGGRLSTSRGTVKRTASRQLPGTLLLTDTWTCPGGPGQSRFLVPADWEVRCRGTEAIVLRKGRITVSLEALAGRIELAGHDMWCRRYMAPEPAHVLVLSPEIGAGSHCAALRVTHVPAPASAGTTRLPIRETDFVTRTESFLQ